MRLPSRTTGAIALVLLLTVAVGLAWHYYSDLPPKFDDVGGTLLVYQLDQRAKKADDDIHRVAEVLERRFAIDGMRHVTVQAGERDQIEVRIPRTRDHDAKVKEIKDLVASAGRLEFRILANGDDDREAIDAAQEMINRQRLNRPALDQELQFAQKEGMPPPGPRTADGEPQRYELRLVAGQVCTVSYSWVEVSQLELHALSLDGGAQHEVLRDRAWKEAAAHRGEALQLPEPSRDADPARLLLQGALFYSRPCEDRNLPEDQRRPKEIDFFVLARDPEFDSKTGKCTPDIDGSFLTWAFADRDAAGTPIIGFAFNRAGGDLFGNLTRKNVSQAGKTRHLAIILDGQVMSAPTINAEIRDRGAISGSFTPQQVNEIVSILRAGAMPATLLPRPVREVEIEPRR